MRVSSLPGYAEALGGRLGVVELPDRTMTVDLPRPRADTAGANMAATARRRASR